MPVSQEIVHETEEWLKKPVHTSLQEAISVAEELLAGLHAEMQAGEASRKTIGALIGRVKGMQKQLRSVEMMNWVEAGQGALAIGHRPGGRLITDLKLQNATHILTLLSEHEGGKLISSQAKKAGMEWLWFPMESANPPAEDRYQELADLFRTMQDIVNNGGRIYIHCSAGIHRTGMITYTFLRFCGLDAEAASKKLQALRPVTGDGVGDERMEWGNSVYEALQAY